MMSKLSPEERIRLRNLYKHERISKLENLKQLADMPMLDDSYIDEETIKYLAYDEQNEDFMNKLHRVDKSGVSPFQKRAQNEANYIQKVFKEKGFDIEHIEKENERIQYAFETNDYDELVKLKVEWSEREYNKS